MGWHPLTLIENKTTQKIINPDNNARAYPVDDSRSRNGY